MILRFLLRFFMSSNREKNEFSQIKTLKLKSEIYDLCYEQDQDNIQMINFNSRHILPNFQRRLFDIWKRHAQINNSSIQLTHNYIYQSYKHLKFHMAKNNFDNFTILPQEWLSKESEGITYYKNKVTNQEFQLFRLNPNHISSRDLKAYLQRSICPIPKTPKVIIFESYTKEKAFNLFIQRSSIHCKNVISKLTLKLQYFQHIRQCCKVAQSLYLRYGNYCMTEDMLKFDMNGQLLLWINKNYVHNRPLILNKSCQSNSQRVIILQIVNIYQKYCRFDLKQQLLIPIPNSFAQFQIKMQHIIKNQKKKINDLTNQAREDLNYTFSQIQTDFQENTVRDNQNCLNRKIFLNRKDKIPKFISQMSSKILDKTSLHHPQTKITINQKQHRAEKLQTNNKMRSFEQSQLVKTVRFNSIQKQEDTFTAQRIKESTQTLPNKKNQRNISLRKQSTIDIKTPLQKTTINKQKSKFQVHKRGQPVCLLDLCHKFRVSQYFDDQFDDSMDFSAQQTQNISQSYYFESRPVTFYELSSQNNLEEQISKLIW